MNKEEIINWINDDFSLTIDDVKRFINVGEAQTIELTFAQFSQIFPDIFQAIKNYLNNHPEDFLLGHEVHENTSAGDEGVRSWWSPYIDRFDPRGSGGNFGATTRRIENRNGNFIHPNALTEEQYEELKNLISHSNIENEKLGQDYNND